MLSFSQRTLSVLSFIISLLGLAGIGVSIYLLVTSFNWSSIVSNFQSTMVIIFIVVSVLVFITGLLGLFGSCNGNTCCLGFFTTLIVLWLLLFLVAGILSFVFPKVVLDRGCETTRMNVVRLKDRMTYAQNTFCNSTCQCYYQNPAQLYLNSSNNPALPTNVMQCQNWNTNYQDTVLEQLQKQFSCSGWCTGTQGNFYKFTNVNNGFPTRACFDAFNNWFKKYGKIIGIISFVIAGILFITTFISGCAVSSIREQRMMRKQIYGGFK